MKGGAEASEIPRAVALSSLLFWPEFCVVVAHASDDLRARQKVSATINAPHHCVRRGVECRDALQTFEDAHVGGVEVADHFKASTVGVSVCCCCSVNFL